MILITGATSGIGKACAEILASQGKNLFLVGRRLDRLQKLQKDLSSAHKVKVEIAPLDISHSQSVIEFGTQFSSELSQVEALINNAGLAVGRDTIQEGNLKDWDTMWDVNVKGLLYMTHQVLPYFVQKKSGHIVNLGSVAGRWIYPRGNIYCATKRAVSALTEALRQDLLGTGVRVTEISPGMVETEFSLVRFGGDQERAKAIYEGMTPLSAKDIAEAVVWALMRPKHVNIQEMIIYPTDQASTSLVHRRNQK
ncbi:MAG: SDR family NAD(P)-dependent oxidoreductase [Proteobacteria bacterium]|nr:SDR family NAD(P)-dependent oxidoreductase [Pseudomonadota bacterium]